MNRHETFGDLFPPGRRFVVVVEGLCFAGKTTLANTVAADAGVATVSEYADLADLPPFPPANAEAVAAALHHFLAVERDRAALAAASGAAVVLCDRSPLSLIAYEHGMRTLGIPRDPILAIDVFAAASDRGEILTPHAYIHLHIDPGAAHHRQAAQRAPIRPHLRDPQVQADMDNFYRRYLDAVPPQRRLQLDGDAPLPDNLDRTRTFLRHLPRVTAPNPPSWRRLLPTVAAPRAGSPR